jgi:hypothetical protein
MDAKMKGVSVTIKSLGRMSYLDPKKNKMVPRRSPQGQELDIIEALKLVGFKLYRQQIPNPFAFIIVYEPITRVYHPRELEIYNRIMQRLHLLMDTGWWTR